MEETVVVPMEDLLYLAKESGKIDFIGKLIQVGCPYSVLKEAMTVDGYVDEHYGDACVCDAKDYNSINCHEALEKMQKYVSSCQKDKCCEDWSNAKN